MSAKLTNGQKGYLAQLATRARNRGAALARGRGDVVGLPSNEEFRHAEVIKACGKAGLRCCSQDDYKLVEGHFLELLGQHGAAFNAQVRAATEPRRVAESKVVSQCQKMGKSLNYADGICRRMSKGLGLFDVGEQMLWKVFYALRYQNGDARRGKRAQAGS